MRVLVLLVAFQKIESECLRKFLQNLPFYRIFAADSRSPRDGRHLEQLGHYDPIPGKDGNKHVGLNIERIKYWLSVGAQPSGGVELRLPP